jgi:bifunctional NMN adenylyltransferase/nudix hydrolase
MNEFGVLVGKFQPFDTTRLNVVRFALTKVQKLIIAVGGDARSLTIVNPWSTDQRIDMIKSCLIKDELDRIEFIRIKDYLYNENLWIASLQAKVDALSDGSRDVVLIGHKTGRNHYSQFFPQWEFIETNDLSTGITSNSIREKYFTLNLLDIKRHVPEPVLEILRNTMMLDATTQHPSFVKLKDEFHHIVEYKELWCKSPFPPTFVTVDAVVIKSGHVLVVRRRGQPGKGLIALPGGFINHETIFEACLRELREETVIKLSKEEIAATLKDQKVFDHPDRSLRGRTITHAFCFNLGSGPLPRVKGEDDAEKAWWMSLRDVLASEDQFFEDHFHIINHFVNKF